MIKEIKRITENKKAMYPLMGLLGLLIGWILFAPSTQKTEIDEEHLNKEEEVWTCSMHPQIKQSKPGKCPICGMTLILLQKESSSSHSDAITLSEEAMAMANLETTIVVRSKAIKQLHLYGKIEADERKRQSQTSPVSGRIESLTISFTGESVEKGQTLAKIYSPERYTAEQELLEAIKMEDPPLINAAREKLRLWQLSDQQIEAIEKGDRPSPFSEIRSNVAGIVLAKNVNVGDYVSQGTILFEVTDLYNVWALFEAFETDLPFLHQGQRIEFTVQALPEHHFSGIISFVDPIINRTTRTAGIRVDVNNRSMLLKPGMYATAEVNSKPNKYNHAIIIPANALLWTGKRAAVYVKLPEMKSPTFIMREIELGPSLNKEYVVLSGLTEGEEIVSQGTFVIDASAQLEGKRSMMNNDQAGEQPSTRGDSTLKREKEDSK